MYIYTSVISLFLWFRWSGTSQYPMLSLTTASCRCLYDPIRLAHAFLLVLKSTALSSQRFETRQPTCQESTEYSLRSTFFNSLLSGRGVQCLLICPNQPENLVSLIWGSPHTVSNTFSQFVQKPTFHRWGRRWRRWWVHIPCLYNLQSSWQKLNLPFQVLLKWWRVWVHFFANVK